MVRPKTTIKAVVVAVVTVGIVVAVFSGYPPNGVGRAFLVFFCLGVILAFNTSQDTRDSLSDIGEVISNLLLSVIFGWAIGTTAGVEPTKQDWAMTGMIALVFFSVTLIRRSTATASHLTIEMQNAMGRVDNLTGRMNETIEQMKSVYKNQELARLVVTLAENLNVRKQIDAMWENKRGNDNNVLRDKATSGFETASASLRQWLDEGARLKDTAPSAQDAWWTAMRLYHQEEVYGVAGKGLATSVRNYAMMLVGFLRSFSEEVLKSASDSAAATKKLVLVNVSTFAPKDMLNFPGGFDGRNRFYYEPQFYGTYRRLLSFLTQNDDSVEVRRICICHDGRAWTSEEDLRLGTGLDGHYKIAMDLLGEYLMPIPGEVSPDKGKVLLAGQSNGAGFEVRVPNGEPSAARTVLSTSTYRMMPRLRCDLPKEYPQNTDSKSTQRRVNISKGWDVYHGHGRHSKNLKLDAPSSAMRSDWRFVALLHCSKELKAATEGVANKLIRLLAWSDGESPLIDSWSAIDWGVQGIKREGPELKVAVREVGRQIVKGLDEALLPRTVEHRSDPAREKALRAMRRLLQDQRNIISAVVEGEKRNLVLAGFDLAEAAQELDVIWRQDNPERGLPLSESGVPVGPMEAWIYLFLVYVDAIRWVLDERFDNRLPLTLDVFMRDYLGGCPVDAQQVEKQLKNTFRLIPVPCDWPGRLITSGAEPRSLPAEFLLLGEVSSEVTGEAVIARAKWHAAVVTNLSEPFSTCRIQFLFETSNEDSKTLRPTDLGAWVRDNWHAETSEEINAEVVTLIGDIFRYQSGPSVTPANPPGSR